MKYTPGLETEHNKTGTCVTEQGEECSNPKSGVSCRPGQLGVPSDFAICPQKCTTGNRKKGPGAGFLFGEYFFLNTHYKSFLKVFEFLSIPGTFLC